TNKHPRPPSPHHSLDTNPRCNAAPQSAAKPRYPTRNETAHDETEARRLHRSSFPQERTTRTIRSGKPPSSPHSLPGSSSARRPLRSPNPVIHNSGRQQRHEQEAPPKRTHQPQRPHLSVPQEISSPPADAASADPAASENRSS